MSLLTERPLIGLTIGPEKEGSLYLRLRSTYTRAVEQAGGVPVLIPPLGDESLRVLLGSLDGIVLPGGADVDPSYYGEPRDPRTDVIVGLDELELAVSRWAVGSSVPTLGICRGQQVLNVACGGKLIQHIEEHRQGEPRDALRHSLDVLPSSRLAAILGTRLEVNTHHHQAVSADAIGQGLHPVAWSPDGIVEGLESDTHPWLLAVQFHPEDLVGFHAPSQRLFESFIAACRARRPAEPVYG
jgi:putative glutamine amidotransferase